MLKNPSGAHTECSAATIIKASLVSHSSMHCKYKLTDSQAVMHSCTQQASSIKHQAEHFTMSWKQVFRGAAALSQLFDLHFKYGYYLFSMINTIIYRIWHKVALFSQLKEKKPQELLHKFWLTLNSTLIWGIMFLARSNASFRPTIFCV